MHVMRWSILACLFTCSQAADGSYSYPYDADAWGGLCKSGKAQSPIDLPKCQNDDTSRKVELTYKVDETAVLSNTGTAIKIAVAAEKNMKMKSPTGDYTLLQCHWHYGSEHTIDDKQYDFVGHCVHSKDGSDGARYGVFGFMYTVGDEEDSFLKLFEDALPAKGANSTTMNLDLTKLSKDFGTINKFYTYNGSLTTPGCNEVVDWHVNMKIGSMTKAQLDKFKTAIGWVNEKGNFRPPQALNGRVVTGCAAATNDTASTSNTTNNNTTTTAKKDESSSAFSATSSFILSTVGILAISMW